MDGHGNVATYTEMGGGAGVGANAQGGLTVRVSNGDTIKDVSGAFTNINAGAGAGVDGSIDVALGATPSGQTIVVVGVTVGVGIGAEVSASVTDTSVGDNIAIPGVSDQSLSCKKDE